MTAKYAVLQSMRAVQVTKTQKRPTKITYNYLDRVKNEWFTIIITIINASRDLCVLKWDEFTSKERAPVSSLWSHPVKF